jgi:ABC-2 type transport system ATP-binding protein
MTIIYTSHYMEEVQALCPRIGIIDHGKLIACETLVNLLRTLRGRIRFQVPEVSETLRTRFKEIPDSALMSADGQTVEIECREVRPTLLKLVAVLKEAGVNMTALETQEPNLERVFLHLTGRGLRD